MRVRELIPVLVVALAAAACGIDDESGVATDPTTATPDTEVEVDESPADDGADATVGRRRVPVIVDYSPTTSDVAALLYVTQHPSADLLAVTLAGTGESHCDRGVANTRALLALVGVPEVPVACGQATPIGAGNEWPPDWREAADRLDGLDLGDPDLGDLAPADPAGAAALLASIAADHGPVTIIALGPLTNLAAAIDEWPELPDHVAEVVTMGGAVGVEGNAPNGVAEWNYFIDPTAVDRVLRSGIAVTIVPLDATNSVPVTKAWFDALAGHRTTIAADAVHGLFAESRPYELGFYFWDELAAAAAFDPTVVTFEQQPVVIDLDGTDQGRTRIGSSGAMVRIAVAADRERFERELLTTLNGGLPPPAPVAASAAETEYFIAVEEAVTRFSAAFETLFQTPLAEELEAIEDRANAGELTLEDDATIRAFLTGFWSGAAEHLRAFRADVDELDPPGSIRREHDGYVAALDALIASSDDRIAEVAARDPNELLTTLWESNEEIDATTAACEALGAAAARFGIDASTCPL